MTGWTEQLQAPSVGKGTILAALLHPRSNDHADHLVSLIREGHGALWIFDPEVAARLLEIQETEFDTYVYEAAAKALSRELWVEAAWVHGSFWVSYPGGEFAELRLGNLRGKGRGEKFIEALRSAIKDF